MSENKIKATAIFEMMGRPPEHVEKTMAELLEAINKEKGIKVSGKNIHELKKVEQKDKDGKAIKAPEESALYSTFSEAEIEAGDIFDIVRMCFKYMPAHIEVIEPADFELSNLDLASLMNEILAKMHNYDAIAKSAIMQNQMLALKLKEMLGKQKNKTEKSEEQEEKEE